MTLHLIKLPVGAEGVDDWARNQPPAPRVRLAELGLR